MNGSVGTPLFWSLFLVVVFILLSLDLGIFHRKAHEVRPREAMLWSIVWVALSCAFGLWVYFHAGSQKSLEFFTGYLIEYALSVDNVFVFIIIFSYFAVPKHLHHRALFWGILGALVMRGAFILIGTALLHAFHWIIYVFGVFLIYTGFKVMRHGDAEVEPQRNPIVRLFQRMFPMVATYTSESFFTRSGNRWFATPLAVVLVTIETTDVVFALDSIPAVFAITTDPFIVYTSNVCAILGLRSMYFLLAAVMKRFVYLGTGLGVVLMFVGAKMVFSDILSIPIAVALGVVALVLGVSIAASLIWPRPEAARPLIPKETLLPSDDQEI
jgi:TerC family integral membrane protein